MLHILKCCLILAAAGLVSCGGNKQALRPPASFYRVSGQETGEYRLESAAIRVELEHGVEAEPDQTLPTSRMMDTRGTIRSLMSHATHISTAHPQR